MTTIGGVDEAGRGCIVGPLVMAIAEADGRGLRQLVATGVKDSKLLSPQKREEFYPKIMEICTRVEIVSISPKEIDLVATNRAGRKLNYLEAVTAAGLIEQSKARLVIVDSPEVKPETYKRNIIESLHRLDAPLIKSMHYADRDFPIVGAASIIAKVERDKAVEKLKKQVGDFGSGYPGDSRTQNFLTEYVTKNGMPGWVRKSWKSWDIWLTAGLPV
jgi:ribonuclease HII